MPLPDRYNINRPIRREILDAHPAWLFAYDEEGLPGQSEATIKPNDLEDPALPGFVVADVRFADGTDALALIGGSFGVASSDDLDEMRLYLGAVVWPASLSCGSLEQHFLPEPFSDGLSHRLPMRITGR